MEPGGAGTGGQATGGTERGGGAGSGAGGAGQGGGAAHPDAGQDGGARGGSDGGQDVGRGTVDAGGGTRSDGGPHGPFPFNPPYVVGADITWTLQDEAAGATYSDGGQVQPLEQIMANYGFNYVRMRTFVAPAVSGGYSPGQGFADIAHTVTWAKRVKACGMGILLDFHMSDTWASIGVQIVPSAWAGLAPAAMQQAAHDYVKTSLAQMVAAGVEPDMVQIGNETNSAMSGVSMSNWANFSGLVNAAIRAVRETDPRIIVLAQHGRPRPDGNFEPWVNAYLTNNPPIDVDGICGSTYGTTNNGADWTQEFSYVINTYNKPVWSCEYTNQRVDLINGVLRALPSGMGRGSFFWEPTRFPQINGGATGANSVLFDNTGGNGGRYTTNAAITHVATLARSYHLPVPSGTCQSN